MVQGTIKETKTIGCYLEKYPFFDWEPLTNRLICFRIHLHECVRLFARLLGF